MKRHLHPDVQAWVAQGLMPYDMAAEFDAWSDKLAVRVFAGELTEAEANALTEARADEDAARAHLLGYPKAPKAET